MCSRVFFFSHRFFIQADKLRAVALEEQINFSGGAVAMLGDDQLRGMERFLPGVFVIVLPIQKHYDVRVLFQRAAFPQVAEHGTLLLPVLHAAAQLAED